MGALARVVFKRRTGYLIAMALGFAILMHSRPWEGAVLGVLTIGVLLRLWRPDRLWGSEKTSIPRAVVPSIAILVVSLGALVFLNYRLTGNALTMPHSLYERQYVVAPMFAFLRICTKEPAPSPPL